MPSRSVCVHINLIKHKLARIDLITQNVEAETASILIRDGSFGIDVYAKNYAGEAVRCRRG